MSEHPLEGLMDTAIGKIKEMVDVNTIIGDAITTPDGMTIIPVSKVTFGFTAGGSDYPSKSGGTGPNPFGGGSGAGVTIKPIAFLVVGNGTVKIMEINDEVNTVDKIVNMTPDIIDKVSGFMNRGK